MKTKLLTIISACLLSLLTFFSCSDSDKPEPLSKEEIWHWGYFKGTINGTEIALENESWENKLVYSLRQAVHLSPDWQDEPMPGSVNIMRTDILYNDVSVLQITLYDLNLLGERYLTLPVSSNWNESSILITVYTDSDRRERKARYIPSEENPFRLDIIDVLWVSSIHPILEVKLDGVLYNEDNPEDVIVINGEYGAR